MNYKIEGFYAVCKAKGLTGDQGVMIPKLNERNLMLNDEVVQAVQAGTVPHLERQQHRPGDRDPDRRAGRKAAPRTAAIPRGRVNFLVDQRLESDGGKHAALRQGRG